jgi:hypothetical protein
MKKIRQAAALGLYCGLSEFFKNSADGLSSKHKMYSSCIFGDRFGGQKCCLYTYNIDFCMKRLRTLNSYKNFKIKIKKSEACGG